MEIILLENIENLGSVGDKVNVKAGFARNYLVPHGKAKMGETGNLLDTLGFIWEFITFQIPDGMPAWASFFLSFYVLAMVITLIYVSYTFIYYAVIYIIYIEYQFDGCFLKHATPCYDRW